MNTCAFYAVTRRNTYEDLVLQWQRQTQHLNVLTYHSCPTQAENTPVHTAHMHQLCILGTIAPRHPSHHTCLSMCIHCIMYSHGKHNIRHEACTQKLKDTISVLFAFLRLFALSRTTPSADRSLLESHSQTPQLTAETDDANTAPRALTTRASKELE